MKVVVGRSELPFATYDVAVYLPGGAIILILLAQILPNFGVAPLNPALELSFARSETVIATLEAIFWLGASYLTGHLASFISTYVIEKPLHNWLGYPSQNWLVREGFKEKPNPNSEYDSEFRKNYDSYPLNTSSLVGVIAQLPVLPFLWVANIIRPSGFYVSKIPIGQKQQVEAKLVSIGFCSELSQNNRWEKIVEHYVANNCPEGFRRMYNYLVIFGALRLISLILLGVLWWLMMINVVESLVIPVKFSLFEFMLLFWISILYILSVVAFAKFNRRYFEESIYAFVLSEPATKLR